MATVLAGTLFAPMTINAEDQILAMAPAAPSWDDASGYGSGETSRAQIDVFMAPTADSTWEATSGYRAVEANRQLVAQEALRSGDLGSMQEEALAELVAASLAWDDASGYGSLEATRANR